MVRFERTYGLPTKKPLLRFGGTTTDPMSPTSRQRRFSHDPGATIKEDSVYSLAAITADPRGNGTSVIAVPMVLGSLLSGEAIHVDVHEGDSRVADGELPHGEVNCARG